MIGISYFKKNKELAERILKSLEGNTVLIDLDAYEGTLIDELISIGGDGTFAKSVSLVNFDKIIGVRSMNSVGAHCYCNINEWSNYSEKLKNNEYKVSERNKIKAELNNEFTDCAVNEIIISAPRWGGTFKYELIINNEKPILTSGSALFIYTEYGYSGFLKKLLKDDNAKFKGDGIASIASNYGFSDCRELLEGYEVKVKIKDDAFISIDGRKYEKELSPDDEIRIINGKYKIINF